MTYGRTEDACALLFGGLCVLGAGAYENNWGLGVSVPFAGPAAEVGVAAEVTYFGITDWNGIFKVGLDLGIMSLRTLGEDISAMAGLIDIRWLSADTKPDSTFFGMFEVGAGFCPVRTDRITLALLGTLGIGGTDYKSTFEETFGSEKHRLESKVNQTYFTFGTDLMFAYKAFRHLTFYANMAARFSIVVSKMKLHAYEYEYAEPTRFLEGGWYWSEYGEASVDLYGSGGGFSYFVKPTLGVCFTL